MRTTTECVVLAPGGAAAYARPHSAEQATRTSTGRAASYQGLDDPHTEALPR